MTLLAATQEMLSMVPQPVQALILCFPVTQVTDAVAKSGVSACLVVLACV